MDDSISPAATAPTGSMDATAPAAVVPRKQFQLGRRGILWTAIGCTSAFWFGVYWIFVG